eukprot:TRINITY_DN5321_c0_g1_i2.p1 TRINITY_DN5321_c0_g1~~TRINITY_DN5321_c0_g1_i2.p1  ORF type:complete len:147 (-),score=15.33 TRINITY_DN5321_c0_g1_i2:289-729(-)
MYRFLMLPLILPVLSGKNHFEIKLLPVPGSDNPSDNNVGIKMTLKIPPNYPTQAPDISLQSIKNVPKKILEELEASCREEAQNSVGDPMIFVLTSIIKGWLDEHVCPIFCVVTFTSLRMKRYSICLQMFQRVRFTLMNQSTKREPR